MASDSNKFYRPEEVTNFKADDFTGKPSFFTNARKGKTLDIQQLSVKKLEYATETTKRRTTHKTKKKELRNICKGISGVIDSLNVLFL